MSSFNGDVNFLQVAFDALIDEIGTPSEKARARDFALFIAGAEIALRQVFTRHGMDWRIVDQGEADAKGFIMLDEIQNLHANSALEKILGKLRRPDA